jgi:hypothetical protein
MVCPLVDAEEHDANSAVGMNITTEQRRDILNDFTGILQARQLGQNGRIFNSKNISKMRRFYAGLTHGTEDEKEAGLMVRFYKAFTVTFLDVVIPVGMGHEFESVITGAAMSEEHKAYSM